MRGRSLRWGAAAAAGVACVAGLAVGGTVAQAQVRYPSCRTSQLTVWRGEPGNGAAGSVYYELEFSNVSRTTCSLYGFPGVSALNSRGVQLGSAAVQVHDFPPPRVTLRPGATAHAVLRITNVANFPKATCGPTTATSLRVFPPNTVTASTQPFRFQACSKKGPVYLSVRTVRPGVGIPGYSVS